MYVADNSHGVHAVSFNENNGAAADVSGSSAYSPSRGYTYSVVVDPSNGFVYSDDAETDIFGWKRDKNTGALTTIGTSDAPLAPSAQGSISAVTVTY